MSAAKASRAALRAAAHRAATEAYEASVRASEQSVAIERLVVQNLAGDTLIVEQISSITTIADLKLRVQALNADYVAERVRLFITSPDAEQHHIILADARTLSSYTIGNDAVIFAFVGAHAPFEFVRSICEYDERNPVHREHYFPRPGVCDARLSYPVGVCVSPSTRELFVVEQGQLRIKVLRQVPGNLMTVVRTIGAFFHADNEASLEAPVDICMHESTLGEVLYVVDANKHRVQVLLASDGSLLRNLGTGQSSSRDGAFDAPSGVCVSAHTNEVFVSDQNNHRVQVFRAADGAFVRSFGEHGSGVAQLHRPKGICLSADGRDVIVVDSGNGRVQVFCAADGTHVRSIASYGNGGAQLSARCGGVAVTPGGDVVVADAIGRVQVYTADGTHVRALHKYADAENWFRTPAAVCLVAAADGQRHASELLVVDSFAHCIRVLAI